MEEIRPVYWDNGRVRMIDQTRLPYEFVEVEYTDYREVAAAIRNMIVRGAPAIGVAAALGIALGASSVDAPDTSEFVSRLGVIAVEFRDTRPTAVNLFWAIERMLHVALENITRPIDEIKSALIAEAIAIQSEDIEINRKLGANGAGLINDGDTVLTICNAGALATAGYGTALGVVRAAAESGKKIKVISCETRPRLQGMKLTVWELMKDEIPVTIITDNMAAWTMSQGMVNCVVVGADRIAANGDTANKIGTYGLAILAGVHKVPFYVAAPDSTIDRTLESGEHIPIEQRDEEEVTCINGVRIAPEGARALNPAFDVTPSELITAIITERGIHTPPYITSLTGI